MKAKKDNNIGTNAPEIESQYKKVEELTREKNDTFNKTEHDSHSRLEITKIFLKWYFCLFAGTFIFCGLYNCIVAIFNYNFLSEIEYLNIGNTISLVAGILSSALGFVIGYYFKNKE